MYFIKFEIRFIGYLGCMGFLRNLTDACANSKAPLLSVPLHSTV